MHITLASVMCISLSNVLIDLDNGHELLKSQKENQLDNRCLLLKGHYPLFLQKIKSKFHQD